MLTNIVIKPVCFGKENPSLSIFIDRLETMRKNGYFGYCLLLNGT